MALIERKSGDAETLAQLLRKRNLINKVIVIAPFVGTPAYRAGIHPGDIISAVDGKATDNMSTSEVADLLKGPKGTTVRITILREGTSAERQLRVFQETGELRAVVQHVVAETRAGTSESKSTSARAVN